MIFSIDARLPPLKVCGCYRKNGADIIKNVPAGSLGINVLTNPFKAPLGQN